MPGLSITLTDAGRAALVNAQNTGTNDLTITEVGVSAVHTAGALTGLTSLPNEIKRLSTFGGDVVAADTIHLTIRDETSDTYTLRKFGLYLSNGVLFAVYSQAGVILEKSASALLLLATDIILANLTTANIAFGDTDFINPPATVDQPGVVKLADQAETDAGLRSDVAIVPSRLKVLLTNLLAGKANVAHSHALGDLPPHLYMTGSSGISDWNDSQATRFAFGRLMSGSAGNGPPSIGATQYLHGFNFHYETTGNLTQLALPYIVAPGAAGGIYFRSRYNGTWTGWSQIWTSNTFDPASKSNVGHTHAAGDVVSGTFHVDRIPVLDQAKVSGLAASLAAKLDASAYSLISQLEAEAGTASTIRYFSAERVRQSVAAYAAPISHTHAAGDVVSGTFHVDRIPVLDQAKVSGLAASLAAKLDATAYSPINQAEAEAGTGTTIRYWTAIRVRQAVAAYAAPLSHTHAAADVVSGTFHVDRIPVLDQGKVTGLAAALAAKANAVHAHALSDLPGQLYRTGATGVTDWDAAEATQYAFGRLMGGDAANSPPGIVSGHYFHSFNFHYGGSGNVTQFAVPYLPGAGPSGGIYFRSRYNTAWGNWSQIWTSNTFDPASKSNVGHTHAAGDVVSGTFHVDRIPVLDQAKVSGLAASLAAKLDATAYSPINQAEAEAGTGTTIRYWTATRVRQAVAAYASPLGHTHGWAEITGKPSTFAPSAHTHAAADVTSGVFDVARIPNLTASKITDLLDLVWPAGQLHLFDQAAVPAGTRCLVANGAVVSRSTYARLFAAIGTRYGAGDGATTFQIPDWRGLFFRGLDNGRGLDPGRALGTGGYQASQNLQHRHSINSRSSTGSNDNYVEDGDSDGTGRSMFTGYEGGTEARPVNEALLACISY